MSDTTSDAWSDPAPRAGGGPTQLVLDLDGFEGPIDVLLGLARDQKVDLARISILHLAEQYLAFISEARRLNLELAADYLVMAAWLAYLKSRLLLPEAPHDEEPSSEEMAEILRFQLQRLEAMQRAGAALMGRSRLGQDFFARGEPERVSIETRPVYDLTLYELLKAYADHRTRQEHQTLHIVPTALYSVDAALERLRSLLGRVPDWQTLVAFLPPGLRPGVVTRSAIAATFVASLELAREGRLQLRQLEPFGPLYLRGRQAEPE